MLTTEDKRNIKDTLKSLGSEECTESFITLKEIFDHVYKMEATNYIFIILVLVFIFINKPIAVLIGITGLVIRIYNNSKYKELVKKLRKYHDKYFEVVAERLRNSL